MRSMFCERIRMRVKIEGKTPRCPRYEAGRCTVNQERCLLLLATEPLRSEKPVRLG